jgi:hypothetical protein
MTKLQKSKLKRLLKPIVESILNEGYTEDDLNFVQGKADIKRGRKVVARIINMNVRHGKTNRQYPYNLEIPNMGIR